ncbi:hypothetical protein M378DRAFT_169438 [Amanita muscaria Koide BX008]|uniref:Signal peptidase complex subunit 1 n=1 Tax=Amanita muscaria (strain Koide BX008) TaxID=946122 RepID=A0A0C2WSP2_AMAMK|nr:hypothetical protein M378DRAFT_169438 [Amanita muscaria Koide BX008]
MASNLQELLDGKIDFIGQQLVENLVHYVLVIATTMSFVAGFATQSLRVTFGILGTSTLLLALVVVPPWPMFRQHQVEWLGGGGGGGKENDRK